MSYVRPPPRPIGRGFQLFVTHPYGAEPFRVKRMYNKLAEMVTTGIDIKARVLINRVDSRTKDVRLSKSLREA